MSDTESEASVQQVTREEFTRAQEAQAEEMARLRGLIEAFIATQRQPLVEVPADTGQEVLQAQRATEGQTEADDGDARPQGPAEDVRGTEGQRSDMLGAEKHGRMGHEAAGYVQAAAQARAAGQREEGTRTAGVRGLAEAADGIEVQWGTSGGGDMRTLPPYGGSVDTARRYACSDKWTERQ